MPSADRDNAARTTGLLAQPGPQRRDGDRAVLKQAALDVLLGDDLAGVVDLVAWRQDAYIHVANAFGHSRAALAALGGSAVAGFELLDGRQPIPSQDPLHGVPLASALSDPSPDNARNSYPDALRRLASAFADPSRSPDLHVMHTPRHHWPERGGHLGEHGSLDAGQSRAPLLLSGAGVRERGILQRAARVVDVGPTLAYAAGAVIAASAGAGGYQKWDGAPLTDLVAPGARLVLGLLWDGANCNDLLELATSGALPHVARLLDRGCALAGGAIAEFPSVTLVNHTSALCGVGPGRHGIVGNVFFDRETGTRQLANDASTWHRACDLLRPGVRTLFEECAGLQTACVNEPIDRGAGYSTFELIRQADTADGARSLRGSLPAPEADPHASQAFVASTPDYAWATQVDAFGLEQVVQLLREPAPPALLWWNTTLTDTGHHGGGPYSAQSRAALADADRRLGVVLDVLAARGLLDDTCVLLTADHGSEGADPLCRGDWDDALAAAGIAVRDEGYGMLYF